MAKDFTMPEVLLKLVAPLWCVLAPAGIAVWAATLPLTVGRKLVSLLRARPKLAEMEVVAHGPAEFEAKDTLLLVHGWPDSGALWDTQVKALTQAGYRCLVVTVPGFGENLNVPFFGYSFSEVAKMLAEVVAAHTVTQKVTLVCHDWGCIWGYTMQKAYPERVARMVALDVGTHARPAPAGLTFMLAYYFYNILAYFLGGYAGAFMNYGYINLIIGHSPANRAPYAYHAVMNYPYYSILMAKFKLPRFEPQATIPVLFGSGAHKPAQFHSSKWAAELESTPDCCATEFNCGHWLPEEPSVAKWIVSWLDATHKRAASQKAA